MARPVRIEYPGAFYHLTSRGNQGNPIFRDDVDRGMFLKALGDACERTGWRVHAYVLMPNHYHLLLETPEPNLVLGMKWLQGTYTRRFNLRHKISGHLLQGRYRAVLVDSRDGGNLEKVATYIHLNPARCGLVRPGLEPLEQFAWSSYPLYLAEGKERPPWLHVDQVMAACPSGRNRRGYQDYQEALSAEQGLPETRQEWAQRWQRVRQGWYFGEDDFRERLLGLVAEAVRGHQRQSFVGQTMTLHGEREAEVWLKDAMARLEVTEADLAAGAKSAPAKQVLAWWLWKRTLVSRAWISRRLQMGAEAAISRAVRLVEVSVSSDILAWKARLMAPAEPPYPEVAESSGMDQLTAPTFID